MRIASLLFFSLFFLFSCSPKTQRSTRLHEETFWLRTADKPNHFLIKKELKDEIVWESIEAKMDGLEPAFGKVYLLRVHQSEKQGEKTLHVSEVLKIKQDNRSMLHDIWALKRLPDSKAEMKENGRCYIEIDVQENKIMGRSFCNEINGNIKQLGQETIRLSPIGRSKMMCPNKALEDEFIRRMGEVDNYEREELKLYFFDEGGNLLIEFIKVD